jgi:NAD(P)H-flavin reductase
VAPTRLETFVAQVSRIDDLTHDVRQIRLELRSPDDIQFQAGQFVSFAIDVAGLPYPVTRPYSIASPPSRRGAIDLLFNLVPGGPGSTYLYSLKIGDEVTFRGPTGTFVLRDYPDRRLLFVATGTGIAPIRSMILARLPSATPVTLVWGLRAERDLYYQDDFAALAARHPEFSFTTVLSRPSGSWTGPAGRVQPLVESLAGAVDDLAVYVCGNSSMIASVRSLIRSRGVCPIHFEQYYKDTAVDDDSGRTAGSP